MAKVIVIVEGGCVQEVQTDDSTIDVIIVDYDGREENPNTQRINGHPADVWPATLYPITLDI